MITGDLPFHFEKKKNHIKLMGHETRADVTPAHTGKVALIQEWKKTLKDVLQWIIQISMVPLKFALIINPHFNAGFI